MNETLFKNVSNHASPSSANYIYSSTANQNIYPTFTKSTFNANNRCVTPIIIKNKSRKYLSNSNIKNKKSIKQLFPKYMSKQKHSTQKQNLLFEIQRESKKLKHQHIVNRKLEKKLEVKEIKYEKKIFSIKKLTQMHQFQSLERDIAVPSAIQTKNGNAIKPNNTKNKFLLQSIHQQLHNLNEEYKQNQQKILKLKQSKKYTRFMQNMQQKNVYLQQLSSMKKYKKCLLTEIKKLKRIFQQKNRIKIAELIMQGQIQDKIQGNNIVLYQQIQKINQQLFHTTNKRNSLQHKKYAIVKEIQELKQKYDIPEEVFEAYYNSVYGNSNKIRVVCKRNNFSESTGGFATGLKQRLESLKQEEAGEEEQSGSFDNHPQIHKRNTCNTKKDTIKQTAVQTVKIHSSANSDFGDEFYLPQKEQQYYHSQKSSSYEKKKIQKLEKKYFNNEEQEQYDDYEQQQDEKQYGSQNAANDGEENSSDQNYDQQDYQQQRSSHHRKQSEKQKAKKTKEQPLIKNKQRTISM